MNFSFEKFRTILNRHLIVSITMEFLNLISACCLIYLLIFLKISVAETDEEFVSVLQSELGLSMMELIDYRGNPGLS